MPASPPPHRPPSRLRATRGWVKPTLLFVLALVAGAIASVLWLRRHPLHVPAAGTGFDTELSPVPMRRALPVPAVDGRFDLPPPTTPAPDAPHVVAAEPVAPPAPTEPEADAGAETRVGQAATTPADGVADHGPRVSEQSPPRYPRRALREGIEGTVRLTVSIDAMGNVVDVQIAQGSGSAELDRAAQDAVREWRYQPAIHDGQPVASTLEIPVDFKLDGT